MSCSYCCRMTCALTRLCSIVFVVFILAPRCDARRSLLAGDGNSEDLFAALSRQDSESIQLVQNLINGNSDKVNVHAQTSGGESTLHLACIWGQVEKVKALLEAGSDPNVRAIGEITSLAMTPLTWCAYAGYSAAVRELLADPRTSVNMIVYQEDGELLTALDIALKIQERGSGTAAALREAGGMTVKQLRDSLSQSDLQTLLPPPHLSPRSGGDPHARAGDL